MERKKQDIGREENGGNMQEREINDWNIGSDGQKKGQGKIRR